jgi:hypothetical protein
MTQSAMIIAIKNASETAINPALVSAGLDAIDEYLETPPTDDARILFCVYLAEGDNSTSRASEAFILQLQLPKSERPDLYLSAIWPVLLVALKPIIVGMTDREISHMTWYPSEVGMSFIYFEVRFSRDLDDGEN